MNGEKTLLTDKWLTAPETWSPILQEASKIGDVKVIPYDVEIGYDLWSYSMFSHLLYGFATDNMKSTL